VGSAPALPEPTLNTVASHFHEKFSAGIERRRALETSPICVQARFSH
jgi:uncharacterized membrane protein